MPDDSASECIEIPAACRRESHAGIYAAGGPPNISSAERTAIHLGGVLPRPKHAAVRFSLGPSPLDICADGSAAGGGVAVCS